MNLVLGATGYVGGYLARALESADTILHCRSNHSLARLPDGYRFVVEDLALTRKVLAGLNPETAYILARPLTDDAAVWLDFAENLQWLLQEWVERGCLKRIAFFSSQLVYATPRDRQPLTIDAPTRPQSLYDFHKLQIEACLGVLSSYPTLRSVEIFRLPLVGGRPCPPGQIDFQYLFKWEAAYRRGLRWHFAGTDPQERDWGNSWVHMDDLVDTLVHEKSGADSKYHVIQPVSGHFTYQQLHRYFLSRGDFAEGEGELALPKTSFFLQDNAGLRDRSVESAFGAAA
jgi:nucleoside-diphosphate-sugar epimerase